MGGLINKFALYPKSYYICYINNDKTSKMRLFKPLINKQAKRFEFTPSSVFMPPFYQKHKSFTFTSYTFEFGYLTVTIKFNNLKSL